MEITKIQLENLKYKVLRTQPIKGILKLGIPPFDVVSWTRDMNNEYGPNYLIEASGTITQVLPPAYKGTSTLGLEDDKVIVYCAETKEADKSFGQLEVYLNEKIIKPKITGPDEAAKPHHTERSEVSNNKKSKGQ